MPARRRFPLLPPNSELGWTPYAWLIYLPTFLVSPVIMTREGHASIWMWVATIGALVLFLATYFRGFWVRGSRLLPIVATHTALGILFSPINLGASVLFVYAASFVAQLERQRDALGGVLLIAATGAATALAFDVPLFYWVTSVPIVLVVGGVNLHFYQEARARQKLRLAHGEIEQLAAIAERERIARDLHDVLGHTLSLIVLKAELAVKLSARDPERAAREMRDVEDVARRTLHEVRQAIRGYRATLLEEVDRSRAMLKAARIEDDFDVTRVVLPQPVEETLALALREAVTNVVRHSGAARCRVRLASSGGNITLEVQDDGRGSPATPGLGLRGMRERVEELGGTLALSSERGTNVVVTLPVGHTAGDAPARATEPAPAAAHAGPAPARASEAAHAAGPAPARASEAAHAHARARAHGVTRSEEPS